MDKPLPHPEIAERLEALKSQGLLDNPAFAEAVVEAGKVVLPGYGKAVSPDPKPAGKTYAQWAKEAHENNQRQRAAGAKGPTPEQVAQDIAEWEAGRGRQGKADSGTSDGAGNSGSGSRAKRGSGETGRGKAGDQA